MNVLGQRGNREWAWVLWGLFVSFVLINRSLSPVDHSEVFLIYRSAALLWLNGQPLYDGSGTGFIYFPQAAILMVPFTWLSPFLDSLLWRLLNIGVFALGVLQFARLAETHNQQPLFVPVTLVSILMAASAAKLGQMTLVMTGLMLTALAELHQKNWWRAALWLVLSFALKPLAAVLILLVAVLYYRTAIPLVLCFIALIGVPFLLQDPGYVWDQYRTSVITMQQVADFGKDNPFAQAFWMLRKAGIHIPDAIQFLLRILFAALTLGYCWWLKRRQTSQTFLIYLFTLAACYALLFNPRTENNTYALLAPAVGVFTAWSLQNRGLFLRTSYLTIVAGFLLSNRIGKLLTGFATVWIKPLLCSLFLILVIYQSLTEPNKGEAKR